MHVLPYTERLFLAGYITCFAYFNLVAYLISSFYQKKFSQPSPRIGFVAGIGLAIFYGAGMFIPVSAGAGVAAAKLIVLFGASLSSAWSAVALYYTMKRVRK